MDKMGFPPGFRFKPSDRELIEYYLTRKVSDQLVLPDCIKILERQMYGDQLPWEVLTEDDPWDCSWDTWDDTVLKQKELYVFSKLIQTGNKRRAARTAGCGTWGGKQVGHPVKTGGRVIGRLRSFTFGTKDESVGAGKGRWRMHEYSMDNTDLVVCRIIVDNIPQEVSSTVVVDQLVGGKRKHEWDQIIDDCADHKRVRANADPDEQVIGQQEFLNTETFAADLEMLLEESYVNEVGASMVDETVGASMIDETVGAMGTYMEPVFELSDFGELVCSGFVPQPVL